jgi:Flp pilus assembly protein TadG
MGNYALNMKTLKCAEFARDKKGNVAIIFAFALLPILYFVDAAIDYQRFIQDRAKLQTGADQAALFAAGAIGQYLEANQGSYPSASAITTIKAQANAFYAANTSNLGSIPAASFHVCTPSSSDCAATLNNASVALQPGQVAVTATLSQRSILPPIGGATAFTVSASSMARTNYVATPTTLNYQFQYAKGWYYKVVTLWATASGAKTPTALATWTYQPTNLNDVAYPPATLNLTSTSGFPSSPTDGGIGVVTTWYAPSTVVDASGTITLSTYSNIYLTMDVQNGECAPGQSANTSANATATSAQTAYYSQNYADVASTNTTVTCSGTAGSSFSMSMSTASATNSDYIYINGVEQPANTVIPLLSAFPCSTGTSGQSKTIYYSWEDSNNSTSGDRDFFFSMTTTCSSGNWTASNAAAPILMH